MNRFEKKIVCDLHWCQLIMWFDENEVAQVELIDKKDSTHNIQVTAEWFANEFLTSAAFILNNIDEISLFRKNAVQGKEVLANFYDSLPSNN